MIKITKKIAIAIFLSVVAINLNAQCCNYKISMRDSYGDGWNGATLKVLINNIVLGNYSAVGYGNSVLVSVCSGDSLRLVYTAGQYENENSYQLQDSSLNTVFRDGPTPATGNVLGIVGNCNTLLIQGSNPCTAISIDTVQCLFTSNVGLAGTSLAPNCSDFRGGDIWFKMVVPPSGNVSFETDSGTLNDTAITAWGGSDCTSLNTLGCDDDSGNGYYSYLILNDLTPGATIYVQVFGYAAASGSFKICAKDLGKVTLTSSELPIVMINTMGQEIVADDKIDGLMQIKYNGAGNITQITDSANVYNGHIGISVRGLSSASYPQKPYAIETRNATGANNNVPILGMPAENDWVLLSNFNDRSLLKNLTAFKIFGEMGNYSPRAQLCEVMIDSNYRGIYVIGEKIKPDANRVDVAKLTANDISGDDLTGGYILQQNYWDSNNSFKSNYSPIDHPTFDVHLVYDYPKANAIQSAQKTYIAAFVDSMETALYSTNFADPITGYRKYMDTKSFIDYFLVNELSRNADGFKKSVFFHKDKYSNGGKLNAGPVWDFDWAWKNMGGVCSIYENTDGSGWAHLNNNCFTDNYSTGWYVRLLQDTTFANELNCAYQNYRLNVLDTAHIFGFIDSMRTVVQGAQVRHFKRWPILGISGPAPDLGAVATTYTAEIDSLKQWIGTRIQWLDANMPGRCANVGVNENGFFDSVNCYPNPANDYFLVDYYLDKPADTQAELYNALGVQVLAIDANSQTEGRHSIKINTQTLPIGIYILKLKRGKTVVSKKIGVVK